MCVQGKNRSRADDPQAAVSAYSLVLHINKLMKAQA
jgi:hypothetical protein